MGRKDKLGKVPNWNHIVLGDKQYIASNVWRCPKAEIDFSMPVQTATVSGAHYWIERYFKSVGTILWCIYCHKHKRI